MSSTEIIPIFKNLSIAKNASIVLATPVYLGNCGPQTFAAGFWADLNASGGGITSITYQVGDTPDETFYTPPSAVSICASFKSSIGTASRDRFNASIMGANWIKFKAKENNASPVVIDMDLIISRN